MRVSKSWNPGRKTVELAPSRIRREPVRETKPIVRRTSEQEMWLGAAGVMLAGAAVALLAIGVGAITIFRDSPSNQPPPFGQCYSAGGRDCVVDGDTVRIDREDIAIAGIQAPRIQGAACPAERERGVAAAMGLSDRLRDGEVTVGAAAEGPARTLFVNGRDVGESMIAAGLARRPGDLAGYCG